MHLLIADSDQTTREDRAEQLRLDGHDVDVAATAAEAAGLLRRAPDAFVLAELEEPLGALTLLRALRAGELDGADPTTPTLTFGGAGERLASAHYRAGADITLHAKSSGGLVGAAVDALTARRQPQDISASGPAVAYVTQAGALTVDDAARQVTLHGEPVKLTRREFDLLSALAHEAGQVISRQALGQRVWGWAASSAPSRTIDAHAGRLRGKLVAGGAEASAIQTVHGIGYRLNPPAARPGAER